MPKQVTSPDIAVLDSKIVADLCIGKFLIDLSVSTWIGAGSNNAQGLRIKITNPYAVDIKPYDATFDIEAPFSDVFSYPIPTQAGMYQYGDYTICVELTDSANKTHEICKVVSICEPDINNKKSKTGVIGATIKGICSENKATILVNNPPTYKGFVSSSQVRDYLLKYPTGSQVPPKVGITTNSFSTWLFNGIYEISGSVCALYNAGDNVFYNVKYLLNVQKDLRCTIDECCIFNKLQEIHQRINSDCTDDEKSETASLIIEVLFNYKAATLAAQCGEDASDYIIELERLLQCRCDVVSQSGTPISNQAPSKDFKIEGCNVGVQQVGLTTVYTIDNYDYHVTHNDNGGVITVSSGGLVDCVKTFTVNFDITKAYAQIKQQANASLTEAQAWAAIINKTLNNVDYSCLGFTSQAWANMTFAERIGAAFAKLCQCCGCGATVANVTTQIVNGNIIRITFDADGADTVDIYVDGNFVTTVLASVGFYDLSSSYADNVQHDLSLIPKCDNGNSGELVEVPFTHAGCPFVPAPNVTDNAVQEDCPFDLTTLQSAPVAGLTPEWHTANNTSQASVVADPTNVGAGTYFLFHKDANGCYSAGTQVVVNCNEETSCTAPQNMVVEQGVGGTKISFQSAQYPPTVNPQYVVKRRYYYDADVVGNYTTIGNPVFNAGTQRWEITDATSVPNTLYIYRAFSLCSESSQPYIDYDFANIVCPEFNAVLNGTDIDYDFVPVAGDVNKYTVYLTNASGVQIIDSHTIVSPFNNPEIGTFQNLQFGQTYKVKLVAFIGNIKSAACDIITITVGDCKEPFIQSGTPLPNGVVGQVYNHVLQLTGTPPFVLSNITKPAWMTITLDNNNSTITLSGTPTDAITEDVLFSITNCKGVEIRIVETITSGSGFIGFTLEAGATDATVQYLNTLGNPAEVIIPSGTQATICTQDGNYNQTVGDPVTEIASGECE
jgi:hypothetical protein